MYLITTKHDVSRILGPQPITHAYSEAAGITDLLTIVYMPDESGMIKKVFISNKKHPLEKKKICVCLINL